jgi:phage protein U
MFGSLGTITFQVVNSPQKISKKKGYHYEVLPVIEGPPALQWIYNELDRVKLEFLFHQEFTDPETAESELKAIAAAHNAVPLVYGNGDHEGNFVITDLDRTDIWRADDGTIIAMQMVAELLQYIPKPGLAAIATSTPAVISSSATPPTATYSGVTSVSAPSLPALPAGMTGTDFPASTPLYPTIPKLPYLPAVGQSAPSNSFLNVPLSTATRWGN